MEQVCPPSISGASNSPKNEVKEGHLTKMLVFAMLMSTLGSSFQIGYQLGCINLPKELIKKWFAVSYLRMYGTPTSTNDMESTWAIAVGIFAIGGMFGGIFVGFIADRFGRRKALLYNNILAIAAAVLMTSAKFVGVYHLIIVGRFIVGMNAGLNSGLAPMYLTEISPMNLRGCIGSVHQLFVTIAILVSQILGLPFIFGTAERWPLIFAFTVVPVLFQLSVAPFCPDSPKFSLIARGLKEQAEKDLKKLRGEDDVQAELDELCDEALAAKTKPQVSMGAMFREPLRWPLVLGVFMMLSQQLSGINAAMFYSKSIFEDAGFKGHWPDYATILMGIINVMSTFVSVISVERLGRRTLHIYGLIGSLFSTALIAASMLVSKSLHWGSYFSILFVLFFVISAAIGPGAIPSFFVNEIFPLNTRGHANSIVVLSSWGSNALVGFFFPLMNELLKEYVFFVFSVLLVPFIAFAIKFMPETKNKPLEQIQTEMESRRSLSGPIL